MLDLKEIWERSCSLIRKEISEQNFETWIKPIKLINLSGNEVILSVPNNFYKSWISENYEKKIKEALSITLGAQVRISYEIETVKIDGKNNKERIKAEKKNLFNPRYTFETFVVGPSNQFAHASCLAVAEKPGKVYNPLFIYGGVGLGKTHLLHAIGNKVIRKSNLKVIYTSAEKFMNELIDSIKLDKMIDFRRKYRKADILLIDDIQFIAGKDRTQEEFFHTFNELHNDGKQIVISSDKPPTEMDNIEERLRSRFQWGLIADIKPPDLETRIAILKKKSEFEGIELSDEVAYLIAKRIRSNVRELEGCLIKINAMAKMMGKKIDTELALNILNSLYPSSSDNLSPEFILKTVAEEFNVKISDIKSRKRSKNILIPRQVSMYFIKKFTPLSLTEIGEFFGGMDHSTVINAIKKIENLIKTDFDFRKTVENLERKLEF